MTDQRLQARFAELCREELSAPGRGLTSARHRAIFNAGREDLSLAKLAEAHWDAVAILQEAGQEPEPGARYAVWASEIPGRELRMDEGDEGLVLSGTKEFCSGAALVDRALLTAGEGGAWLVELDLRAHPERLNIDASGWAVEAFRMTETAAVTFDRHPIAAIVGQDHWYVQRPGFWRGAVGPAAAWAGGAAGLVDFVMASRRDDPHTAAHRAAMHTGLWTMQCVLDAAAYEFDHVPGCDPMVRAMEARHAIEQACTDILRRFARCMGPVPLAKNPDLSRRYAELDIFLRQSHGERDLEALGRALREAKEDCGPASSAASA